MKELVEEKKTNKKKQNECTEIRNHDNSQFISKIRNSYINK